MGLKDITLTFLLIFIFGLGIINYAIWFAEDNDAPINLADDLGEEGTVEWAEESETGASSYNVEVEDSITALYEQETPGEEESTRAGATFQDKSGSPTTATINLFKVAYGKIFGGGSAFTVVLSTIVITILSIIAMLWWKAVKGGNPE